MKTNLFIFAAFVAAFLSVATFSAAQVTIGGSDLPKAGTILDLNSTTKGGLLLSNVELKAVNVIPASFPNASAITDDAHKQALAGAMVWNTNDEFPINGDGIYIWDGNKWNYIGGSDGVCIPTGSGTFTGKFCFDIATGNDGINGCGTTAVRIFQKTVFTDRTSQDGVSAAPYSGVQVYTFTPSGTVNNVRFGFIEAVGAGKIVESIMPVTDYSSNGISTACKVTVNYKSSLQNDLSGLTRDTGLKLKLYVIYNDGNADRAIELNISLQDCACCGAYVASGVWKTFMCHNLGANEGADPFTISRDIHGAMYKWGTSVVALSAVENFATSDEITDSNYPPAWANRGGTVPTGWNINWDMDNKNPCPSGWRVPTIEEWQGVLDNNTIYRTADGGTSWSTSTSLTWTTGEEDTGIKFGDALVLPAAGVRFYTNGLLNNRGDHGCYWSSTASTSSSRRIYFISSDQSTNDFTNRSYGFSVRCISE